MLLVGANVIFECFFLFFIFLSFKNCQNTTKLHVGLSVHAIFDAIIIQNSAIMINNYQNSTQ